MVSIVHPLDRRRLQPIDVIPLPAHAHLLKQPAVVHAERSHLHICLYRRHSDSIRLQGRYCGHSHDCHYVEYA